MKILTMDQKQATFAISMIACIIMLLLFCGLQAIQIEQRDAVIEELRAQSDSTRYLVVGIITRQDSIDITLAPFEDLEMLSLEGWDE